MQEQTFMVGCLVGLVPITAWSFPGLRPYCFLGLNPYSSNLDPRQVLT